MGFAAALVKAAAGAASMYAQKQAAARVGDAVRGDVAGAILEAGRGAGSVAHAHAALVLRLREVERGVDEGVLSSIRAAASLVPLAGALIVLSSGLGLLALGVLLPFALALGRARRILRASHARAAKLAEDLHAGLDELVRHLDLWRTFGATGRVRRALAATGREAGRAAARAEAARALLSGANEALAAGALLVVVVLVERSHIALDRGPLVAFATVFFLMYRPLRDLGDARIAVERGALALHGLDGIRADLDGAPALHSSVGTARTPAWPPACLEVQALSVTRGAHVTPPTTLRAEPGELIVLVGPTGSGKTTLLRALLGLERDVTGAVRYGDRDLTAAGVGPAERPFAWVPQEPAIVAGTLGGNVALGLPEEAGPHEVRAGARDALSLLGAEGLVDREGDRLTAGGPELSGGERQWVAIARALSTGMPVLLLDEPTAGLDEASQARVLAALAAVRGRRTILLVTHRPEPLALADRVIRMAGAGGSEESTFRAPDPGSRPASAC